MTTKEHNQDTLELLLFNFNRTEYEQKYNENIPMALKYLMIQFSKKIFPSKILSFKQDLDFYQLILSKLQDKIHRKKINMLYRSSDHNFTAESFHKYCDGHGPTITVIHSNYGNIFGGYAPIEWPTKKEVNKVSGDLFLFLIKSNDSKQRCPLIFDALQGTQSPMISNIISLGPVFGDEFLSLHAISIGDKCNESSINNNGELPDFNKRCYTNSGTNKYDFSALNNNKLPGGPRTLDYISFFKVIDYEVFEII